jgi:hypothetical protein
VISRRTFVTAPGDLCQNCGSELGDEQCDGVPKPHPFLYCRVRAAKKFVSHLIFLASKAVSLGDDTLRSLSS